MGWIAEGSVIIPMGCDFMEQAIFITKTDNLKYVNSKYSRLYFGNEFCERLFSSPEDLKIISDFVLEHRMNFSLVTPFLTNAGIKALKPYLEYTAANFSSPEVIVNDWGMLKLLRDEFSKIQPVLGRLLTKQKRGPRILPHLHIINQPNPMKFDCERADSIFVHLFDNLKRLKIGESDIFDCGRWTDFFNSFFHLRPKFGSLSDILFFNQLPGRF